MAEANTKMSDQDIAIFRELYPQIGAKVSDHLSQPKSPGALRSLAFRLGIKVADRSVAHVTHGMVGTRTYKAWFSAKQRCRNPRNQAYPQYGGAGIKFHDGWDDFSVFLADLGEAPSDKHQIDRIDPSAGYVPGNVRWASPSQNAANTRSKNKTGFRGVDLLPSGRYRALIMVGSKKTSLGVFDTAQEAADAYDRKAVEVFGGFAMLNSMQWAMPDGGAND